jgi:hypothetical protein
MQRPSSLCSIYFNIVTESFIFIDPFQVGLLCQNLDFLWLHGTVVDANVVDQAGEEGAGGVVLVDTDV